MEVVEQEESMGEIKVSFRDLSGPLKAIVILSWVFAGINVLYFIAGFVRGVLGL